MGFQGRISRTARDGLFQAVEQEQRYAARTGQGLSGQRRFGDYGQRSLGAGQQPGHVEIILAQHAVKVVTAAVDGTFQTAGPDQFGVVSQHRGEAVDQFTFVGNGAGACAAGKRLPAELQNFPVGKDHLQAGDVIADGAVFQPAAAGGVQRNHAAHGRNRGLGRIRAEDPPQRTQLCIQTLEHHAGLDADFFRVDPDHMPQVLGKVDDNSGPQRFARRARARARA